MSQTKHRIVFLYSELAGYFLACAKSLGGYLDVASVDIVHWPVNPEAPFEVRSTADYTLHPKANLDRKKLIALIESIDPTAIVCSGWMDRDYNAIARKYCRNIPVVLTMDNWWTGSRKQWLAVLSAPLLIRRHFNRAWVPGDPQLPFARKLGFSEEHLATGFYCADPEPFLRVWETRKNTVPSKKLLYIGRYLPIKGVQELWTAFATLSNDFPEWELHCIGTGDLWDARMIHPKIVHHGFLQTKELIPHVINAAAFIMPSKKEPWGVVLHEMAIAGLPLIASKAVGASSKFIANGENGIFLTHKSIAHGIKDFLRLSPQKQAYFSAKSHQSGIRHNHLVWGNTLQSLLKK